MRNWLRNRITLHVEELLRSSQRGILNSRARSRKRRRSREDQGEKQGEVQDKEQKDEEVRSL